MFTKEFMLGASTAGHQVEGNNVHSDFWAMEQMEHSEFQEPSLDGVDHYHRYKEDLNLMKEAGLNAYRFSIEWARVEPKEGCFDQTELEHYREMLVFCREQGITPVVTMHHFASPKWLIEKGGWEWEGVVERFRKYCVQVVEALGDLMEYVCTINEANMGMVLSIIQRSGHGNKHADVQVGVNLQKKADLIFQEEQKKENLQVFGVENPQSFLEMRSAQGDRLIMRAHEAARDAMKAVKPHLKVGVTFSLHDFQPVDGGEEIARREWDRVFGHYVPFICNDDFVGVQNYTRKLVNEEGFLPVPKGAERTEMFYEFYPQALEHVIRKVAKQVHIPILVTENGVGTVDDERRIAFLTETLAGVQRCKEEGIPVFGYLHWSLLDNFEWQKGYSIHFGLIQVDRETMKRTTKPSLKFLGSYLQA